MPTAWPSRPPSRSTDSEWSIAASRYCAGNSPVICATSASAGSARHVPASAPTISPLRIAPIFASPLPFARTVAWRARPMQDLAWRSRLPDSGCIAATPMLTAPRPIGDAPVGCGPISHGAKFRTLQEEPERVENSGGIQASLSGRYATALFELARDSNTLPQVEAGD